MVSKTSERRKLTKSIRIGKLFADLSVMDRVVTLGQVERHYDLSVQDLRGSLALREAVHAPLVDSSKRVRTTFATTPELEEWMRWRPAWELAHLAGTAELRHMLGVARVTGQGAAQRWVLEGGFGEERPDAEWLTPDGKRVAIEYDGGYPPLVVQKKLRAFRKYDAVYWGTPSLIRRAHLYSRHAGRAEFLSLNVFEGSVPARL